MKRLVPYLLVTIILAISGFALQFIPSAGQNTETRPKGKNLSRPVQIARLKCSTHNKSNLVMRFEVDNLQVRPRRIGLFKFNSFNEVYLKNTRIKTYPTPVDTTNKLPEQNSPMPIDQVIKTSFLDIFSSKGFGQIQRVVFDGFSYLQLAKNREQTIIVARSVEYRLKKKEFEFHDTSIYTSQPHRSLIAKNIKWSTKKQAWYVTGKARLFTDGKMAFLEDKWLSTDLKII